MRVHIAISTCSLGVLLLLSQALGATPSSPLPFIGKVYTPPITLPAPLAFFPLTEGQGDEVTSYPYPEYVGGMNGSTLRWTKDDVFGYVFQCDRDQEDLVILDPVEYGEEGPFSVAFWFKANASKQAGQLFEYMFSHSANATREHPSTVDTFHPNQLHMFLPQSGHPAHGLVRSVVKDSAARPLSTFLDSDGGINDNDPREANSVAQTDPVNDGNWHQVILTPLAEGKGFQVYVDGKFAARLPPAGYKATANDSFVVDGGMPMKLDSGNIYLCGRADGSPDRHYSGSISHLQIFDETLKPSQVLDLYESVPVKKTSRGFAMGPSPLSLDFPFVSNKGSAAPGPAAGSALQSLRAAIVQAAAPLASEYVLPETLEDMVQPDLELAPMPGEVQQLTVRGIPCAFPFQWQGKSYNNCTSVPSAPTSTVASSAKYCMDVTGVFSMCSQEQTDEFNSFINYLEQYVDMPFSDLQSDGGKAALCSRNGSALPGFSSCASGYICAGLREDQVTQLGKDHKLLWDAALKPAMVGVCAKPWGVYWPRFNSTQPMPIPAAYFPLTNYSTTSWPVPEYWFWNTTKENKTEWVKDPLFGTAVQCSDAWDSSLTVSHLPWGEKGSFAINLWVQQRQNRGDKFQYVFSTRSKAQPPIDEKTIFFPDQVHIYLPEQDHPAHDTVRVIVKDTDDMYNGNPSRVWVDSDAFVGSNDLRNTPRNNFTDGQWHMVTVTSQPNGRKGYALYIDGALHANLTSPQAFFHVDGGDPINIDSNIVLCGRSDAQTSRFFDGRVAQLALFDTSLLASEVAALYQAVSGKAPVRWSAEAPAGAPYGALLQQLLPSREPVGTIRAPIFTPVLDPRQSGIFVGSMDVSQAAPFAHPTHHGLHPGAIAGIVIAAVAVVAAVAAIVAGVLIKRRSWWRKAEFAEDGYPGVGGAPNLPRTDKKQLFVGEHSSPIDVHVTTL